VVVEEHFDAFEYFVAVGAEVGTLAVGARGFGDDGKHHITALLQLLVAVADEFGPFGLVEQVDEGVAENAFVAPVVKGHIGHRAVVEGEGVAEMFPGQGHRRSGDLDAGYGHAAVAEHPRVAAIACTRNEYGAYALRCKKIPGQYRRPGRFHAPHFLFFGEDFFPEFGGVGHGFKI